MNKKTLTLIDFSADLATVTSLALMVAVFTVSQPSYADNYGAYSKNVIAYGVSKKHVESRPAGTSSERTNQERCIFYPIFRRGVRLPEDYRGWSITPASTNKYPLPHLRGLRNYVVLDAQGRATDIKYESFTLVWSGYPNYFVGSPVPKHGCGNLVVLGGMKSQKRAELTNKDKYIAVLTNNEKELFGTAICSTAARKVVHPANAVFDCKKLLESADLSKSTPIRYLFDGKDHYLVRSYKQPHSLIFYKIDENEMSLIAVPAFIGMGEGEQHLFLEYVMYVDFDNDGVNEVIVKQFGWEWNGIGYLKKENGYWR